MVASAGGFGSVSCWRGAICGASCSLTRLRCQSTASISELMPEPMAVVDGIIRHRLNREAKVAQVLAVAGGTLDELVERAYDDVPRVMFPMARYSLWAHLLKLAREGRAVESGGRWEPPG